MEPLLVFTLAEQEYCLKISEVREVIRMVAITWLPEAPPEVLGAINVHGVPTLVLDLRRRFGLPHRPPTLASPLILVDSQDIKLAVLVDWVIGVAQSATPPDAAGMIRVRDRLVIMLEPKKLPSEQTVPLLAGLERAVLT